MKTIKNISKIALIATLLLTISCKKKKNDPEPAPEPPPTVNEQEVITTFKFMLTDSATNVVSTYMFKDPDGAGGQPAYYGPTSQTQTDSVFVLAANKTYYGQIIVLDETKNPVDSTSNEIEQESKDHMFFYNNGSNTILNAGNPYAVMLNGPSIKITYTDLDNGTPQRGLGLKTKWRTSTATGTNKYKLNITLRHQPGVKDGTYAPGDSDISVDFKVQVN